MITKNMKDSYYLTKAQYEARKQAGTLVEGATYHITDDTVSATTVGIDSTPTSGSNNLVTSGGVKTALDGKGNIGSEAVGTTVGVAGVDASTLQNHAANYFATKTEVDGKVGDVQVNGTSVVNNGVATIPLVTQASQYGLVKIHPDYGITLLSNTLLLNVASTNQITNRNGMNKPIITTQIDYAVKCAMCDTIGTLPNTTNPKNIAWTDAEKKGAWTRLSNIKTTLDAVAVAGASYFLGEQSTVNIALPSDASAGQEITVVFYNGATPATVSITGTMLEYTYVPAANTRSEINALFDGEYWSCIGMSQELPDDDGESE